MDGAATHREHVRGTEALARRHQDDAALSLALIAAAPPVVGDDVIDAGGGTSLRVDPPYTHGMRGAR